MTNKRGAFLCGMLSAITGQTLEDLVDTHVALSHPKEKTTKTVHCHMCRNKWVPQEGGEVPPECCPHCGIGWDWMWKTVAAEKENAKA